ncbi:hypothetical protein QWZ08_13570 [Ferruginibacter paludis]|uniref:hypothetical protein n=1 Tax=Ferruginibacter paludis TaxID=1310417 RepID=UPI0025B3129B|nr:hypothetical protein [Ferruginibacter paludis]MDN3656668.1 hypothetical protein [Ferruginibacter paludis]
MALWNLFKEWFLSLGTKYHVNPYIFGGIYIGAIPLFFISLGHTIKRMKNKQPYALPLLLTGCCFISAYVYLIIVGKNIPVWVYFFIGLLIVYGTYSTILKTRKKI